jgi:periplasmic protein TonB
MSHELFVDVTSTRPRACRAAGGTLAVSIVAHAFILAAVIVVPLLATDALPALPGDDLGPFAIDVLPPPAPPPLLAARTPSTKPTATTNAPPTEAPDTIGPEIVRQPANNYVIGDVGPTGPGVPDGLAEGVGIGAPQPPPPPQPAPQTPVRLSAYEMPRKINDVAPLYPELAQRARVEGVVIIEAVIAVDGTVRDARVLRSVALLDRAAIDAVKQWRYAPTRLNGVAVPVIVTVTVQFRLQR